MAFLQLNLVRLLQILLITGLIETIILGKCNAEEVAPPGEEPTLITGTLVPPVSLLERFQAGPIQTPPEGPRPSQYAEPWFFHPSWVQEANTPMYKWVVFFKLTPFSIHRPKVIAIPKKILITPRVINLMVQASAEQD